MKRIVIIVENQSVPRDRRVWREALSLRDAGYSVHVICPTLDNLGAGDQIVEGITIHRHCLRAEAKSLPGYLREYSEALVRELLCAVRIWKSGPFDVIQVCNPPDLLFLVTLWFKYVHGVAVILDHHDLVPELFDVKFGRRPWAHGVMLAIEYLNFAASDIVLSVNESYRTIAVRRGRKRDEDVFVVRNGPDLSELPDEPSTGSGPDEAGLVVGYLGEVGTQDGLEGLVEIAVDVVQVRGRCDVRFVVIGDGPDLPRIRLLAAQRGVADSFTFTGYLTGDSMWKALSACDVCVGLDPKNAYNDASTMMKVMEYMALGKPIVQFDLREGRYSAATGALYARDHKEFADMVLALGGDTEWRESIGRLGRQRLEESLHWGLQIPVLLAAYRRALAIRSTRSGPWKRVPAWMAKGKTPLG